MGSPAVGETSGGRCGLSSQFFDHSLVVVVVIYELRKQRTRYYAVRCYQLPVSVCTCDLVNTRVVCFAISSVYPLWWQSVAPERCYVSPASNAVYVYTQIALTDATCAIANIVVYDAHRSAEIMLSLGYANQPHDSLHRDCLQAATPRETRRFCQSVDKLINQTQVLRRQ